MKLLGEYYKPHQLASDARKNSLPFKGKATPKKFSHTHMHSYTYVYVDVIKYSTVYGN